MTLRELLQQVTATENVATLDSEIVVRLADDSADAVTIEDAEIRDDGVIVLVENS